MPAAPFRAGFSRCGAATSIHGELGGGRTWPQLSHPGLHAHTTGGALPHCSGVNVDAFQGVISPPAQEEGRGDETHGATPAREGIGGGPG